MKGEDTPQLISSSDLLSLSLSLSLSLTLSLSHSHWHLMQPLLIYGLHRPTLRKTVDSRASCSWYVYTSLSVSIAHQCVFSGRQSSLKTRLTFPYKNILDRSNLYLYK